MTIGGITVSPGDMGVVALLLMIMLMLVTDVLVTGRRLRRAEARADRLEQKVWELLATTEVAVTAAEVSSEAISKLPDPAKDGE